MLLASLGGVLAGALAKIADELPALGVLGQVLTGVAMWLLAAALVARLAPSPCAAAARTAVFFAAMCVGYFGYAALVLGFPNPGRYALAWLILSVTVMPALAAAYQWASRGSGVGHGLVAAFVAATAVGYGETRRAWLLRDTVADADLWVRAAVEILVCLVVALVLPRHHRTRVVAAIALLPVTLLVGVLAGWVLDRLPFF